MSVPPDGSDGGEGRIDDLVREAERPERVSDVETGPGALIDLVLEHEVALTGCPTFYAGQSSSPAARLEMHRVLLDAGVRISLNTDDPAQFGSGWLTNTVRAAMTEAPFTRTDVVTFAQNAIDSAWIDERDRTALTAELRAFVGAGPAT